MLVICPNCKTEFIIHDELTGECPVCGLKLLFKGENEIIERVNIKEIEKRVDEIVGENVELSKTDRFVMEMLDVGEKEEMEEEVDKIID